MHLVCPLVNMQFILDATVFPLVGLTVSFFEKALLCPLLSQTRTWCYSLHKERLSWLTCLHYFCHYFPIFGGRVGSHGTKSGLFLLLLLAYAEVSRFLSAVFFSHGGNLKSKILFLGKTDWSSINLGEDPFPDLIGHFAF